MTIREVSFVYPLLNTLARSPDLEASRKTFLDDFLAKLQPIMDDLASQDAALKRKHGRPVPARNLVAEAVEAKRSGAQQAQEERYWIPPGGEFEAFKAEYKLYKDGTVNARLNASETALFEQLLWMALLGGYEDFPPV